jgi:hypothetical protein
VPTPFCGNEPTFLELPLGPTHIHLLYRVSRQQHCHITYSPQYLTLPWVSRPQMKVFSPSNSPGPLLQFDPVSTPLFNSFFTLKKPCFCQCWDPGEFSFGPVPPRALSNDSVASQLHGDWGSACPRCYICTIAPLYRHLADFMHLSAHSPNNGGGCRSAPRCTCLACWGRCLGYPMLPRGPRYPLSWWSLWKLRNFIVGWQDIPCRDLATARVYEKKVYHIFTTVCDVDDTDYLMVVRVQVNSKTCL